MSQTTHEATVDTQVLVRLQDQTGDEDGELLAELVAVFVEDARETCSRLAGLAQAGPSETVSREAHRLKSGAANLGATVMTSLCKELETKGASEPASTLQDLVTQLTDELARVEPALHAYVDSLGIPLAQNG